MDSSPFSLLHPNLYPENCLPKDGCVRYFGALFNPSENLRFFDELYRTIAWEADKVTLFGKTYITERKIAFYGERGISYNYSGKNHFAQHWTDVLFELKQYTERITGESYNACLLNLYHSGKEGMGWHADNEKEMKANGSIASLSFGAARTFQFKHRITGEKHQIELENGSLLEMKGETQRFWLHQLPKRLRIREPRINVTFRQLEQA